MPMNQPPAPGVCRGMRRGLVIYLMWTLALGVAMAMAGLVR